MPKTTALAYLRTDAEIVVLSRTGSESKDVCLTGIRWNYMIQLTPRSPLPGMIDASRLARQGQLLILDWRLPGQLLLAWNPPAKT